MPFHGIRADVVLEAVTLPGRIPQREAELIFFSPAVEAVKNLQPLHGIHGAAGGAKGSEVRGQVCFHTGKEAPGGIHILRPESGPGQLFSGHAVVVHESHSRKGCGSQNTHPADGFRTHIGL